MKKSNTGTAPELLREAFNFPLQLEDGTTQEIKCLQLDMSDLENLFVLEQKAAEELPNDYILKDKKYLAACIQSGFTVGMKFGETLISAIMVNVYHGNTSKYAKVIGQEFGKNEMIAFRQGTFVLPEFRRKGLHLKLGEFLQRKFDAADIQNLFTAISPMHFHHLKRMTGADREFVIRCFYHAVSNGSLRYLLHHRPNQSYKSDTFETVLSSDHVRQNELFDLGYVGTGLEFKDNAVFVDFQLPAKHP